MHPKLLPHPRLRHRKRNLDGVFRPHTQTQAPPSLVVFVLRTLELSGDVSVEEARFGQGHGGAAGVVGGEGVVLVLLLGLGLGLGLWLLLLLGLLLGCYRYRCRCRGWDLGGRGGDGDGEGRGLRLRWSCGRGRGRGGGKPPVP